MSKTAIDTCIDNAVFFYVFDVFYVFLQISTTIIRQHNTVETLLALYQFKVLEKCTKNLIAHSRLAFNNHESNIDC